MKTSAKSFCAVLILLAGAAASTPASSHGVRFGIGIGVPLYAPWYYAPPPYYHYPAPVIVQSQPPVYIERAPAQAAPAPEQYWYYCTDSRTYYPYVKQCASPWQRVVPQPPAG